MELQKGIYTHIVQRNEIIREVAAEQKLLLIDLFATLGSDRCTDFREDFFDMIHPRPRAYEKIARAVAEGLSEFVPSKAV